MRNPPHFAFRFSLFLVVRLVASLPLDVASEAWFLIGVDWCVRQDCIERSPQVTPVYRFIVAGTAFIQLASVDQASLGIEHEKIGCARRTVSLRDLLALVIAERE